MPGRFGVARVLTIMNNEQKAVEELLERAKERPDTIGIETKIAITALEQAQRELAPRNGHTFESLQKMWEDTHIELAETISKLTEAQRERDRLEAICKNLERKVTDYSVERDELQASIQQAGKAYEGIMDKYQACKTELSQAVASQQICVGAAGIGDFSELCGWIDSMKAKLLAEQAAGAEMRRALGAVTEIKHFPFVNADECGWIATRAKALSTSHGKAFLEERERHVRALERISNPIPNSTAQTKLLQMIAREALKETK